MNCDTVFFFQVLKKPRRNEGSPPAPYPQELVSLCASFPQGIIGDFCLRTKTEFSRHQKWGQRRYVGGEGRLETEVPMPMSGKGADIFPVPSDPQALGCQHWPRFPAPVWPKQPRLRQHASLPQAELWRPVNAEHSRHFLQFTELMRPLGAPTKMTVMA